MIRDWTALLHARGVAMPAKLALAALIALAGPAGSAEPHPDHPITLIVPYAATCCARAASGHVAAAPPSVAKNFRRLM